MANTNFMGTDEYLTNPDQIQTYVLHLPRGTDRLQELGSVVQFKKHEIVLQAGDTSAFAYVILKGKVYGFEYSPVGDERVYSINGPNSIILEDIVLFQKNSPVGFRAATNVTAVKIPRLDLTHAISDNPDISFDIIQSITMKFLAAMQQLREINTYSAAWNVCNLLLIFAREYGVPYDGKVLIQEKITQQLISSMLGMNRITCVRIIQDLKQMGLIEQINGFYCIRDAERLKRHQHALEKV